MLDRGEYGNYQNFNNLTNSFYIKKIRSAWATKDLCLSNGLCVDVTTYKDEGLESYRVVSIDCTI